MPKKLFLVLALVAGLAVVSSAKEKFQQPGPVYLDHEGEKWAEKTLKKLSLEQKIGQMLMIWAKVEFLNVNSPDYQRLRDAMRQYHVGGFGVTVPQVGPQLLKSEPYQAAALLNQLQRESELPLIFAADFERGVGTRLNGSTWFPYAMAFGAAGKAEYAEASGRITAQEARAIGVHWNWFPVADVNSNPVNPVINIRSFGEDPEQVGEMVAAYIRGAHGAGMIVTAKHFPGQGDAATDTHLGIASVVGDQARLETVELPPFRKAIEAGVDAVMVAHVSVPALEPDPNKVATTSPAITTELLKKGLGFKGLVVTDALDMNGLLRLYSGGDSSPSGAAAVAAVKAGNDVVIIPQDLGAAYNALLRAVTSGEIPHARIDEAVRKVLKAKASVGLHKARLVDLAGLSMVVASPQNLAKARQIADDAVTLVRHSGQLLPIRAGKGTAAAPNPYLRGEEPRSRVVAIIFTDDVRAEWGRSLERQLRARVPDANIVWVEPRTAQAQSEQILAAVEQAQTVIAAVYAVPQPGLAVVVNGLPKDNIALDKAQATLLTRVLRRAGSHTALVSLGSPYLAREFPEAQTYLCTFSNVPVSELSAVRALFGEIPVRGRLPVSIPNVAQRGAGLDRLPQAVQGGKGDFSKSQAAP
jgi:beta-N-acetylhexosaminidase